MRQNRYYFTVLALACAVSLFLGCKTETPGPNYGGDENSLPAVSLATADGVKYYSLSTGEELTDPADIASTKWDIAFSRTRLIFTNSGASAEKAGSGGQGGVWYTDKAELSEVSSDDKRGEDDPILKNYITDQKRFVTAMSSAAETILNVMTYVGYENESTADGLSTTTGLSSYQYNKKQYYSSAVMGVYASVGDQTYIIRHGDGEHYSKIKIVYEYADSKDNWIVTYQNF